MFFNNSDLGSGKLPEPSTGERCCGQLPPDVFRVSAGKLLRGLRVGLLTRYCVHSARAVLSVSCGKAIYDVDENTQDEFSTDLGIE